MWGSEYEKLKKLHKLSGKLPPALRDRPNIQGPLADYFKAYFELHSRRGHSMNGELPISVEAIFAYARMKGFDTDSSFFFRIVSECDSEFFDYVNKKRDAKKSSGKNRK